MKGSELDNFLREIKFNFLLTEPFIGTALTYIDINENNDFNICKTLCCYFNNQTFRFNIDYNKYFLKTLLNEQEILAVFKHEVLHILNKHFLRMFEYNKNNKIQMNLYYANVAMDIAINQYIDNLPAMALSYKNYNLPNNLDFESYYKLLTRNINNNSKGNNTNNNNNTNSNKDQNNNSSDNDNKNNKDLEEEIKKLNKQKADNSKKSLNTDDKKTLDKLKSENEVLNKKIDNLKKEIEKNDLENKKQNNKDLYENIENIIDKIENTNNQQEKEKLQQELQKSLEQIKPDQHETFIKSENDRMEELSEDDLLLIEQVTKNIVKESFNRMNQNNLPSYGERLKRVWKREEKVFNWKKITKQFVEKTLISNEKEDTWYKPNKRFADVKGKRKIKDLEILIAVDTSRSISKNTILNFLNEIQLIDKNIKATVIYFHSYVYNVMFDKEWKKKENYSKITMGGTMFQPIFDFAKKSHLKCILILTDGFAESNVKTYNAKSLWIDDRKTKLAIIKKNVIDGNNIFKNYESIKIS